MDRSRSTLREGYQRQSDRTFTPCGSPQPTCRPHPASDGERGVVISTASVAAYDGQIGQAAYAASKGGVVSLTLPAAREFAQFGIRVMAVAPGLFNTPMVEGLPAQVQDSLAAAIRFKDAGQARAVCGSHFAHHREPLSQREVIRLDGAIRMAPR